MSTQNLQEALNYWIKGAESDRKVAIGLYGLGHYHWCLFIWQLVIEKILKAKIVSLDKEVSVSHNLVMLAEDYANLDLNQEQVKSLQEITRFNLEARYDDYKRAFYKKATKEYTEGWVKKCEDLYVWIKDQIK